MYSPGHVQNILVRACAIFLVHLHRIFVASFRASCDTCSNSYDMSKTSICMKIFAVQVHFSPNKKWIKFFRSSPEIWQVPPCSNFHSHSFNPFRLFL
eukprot:c34813_g1_i1 orf=1-288(-)